MGFYSVWPVFTCLIGFLALVSAPAFRAADVPSATSTGDRLATVDGLRGFLALSVFFHHGAVYHQYIIDGSWTAPPSRVFAMLGQFGVAMFFMITGFLFWTRMIESKGRPDWVKLYIGRVFRIGPMYLFVVCAAIIGAIAGLGLNPNIEWAQLAREAFAALFLGLIIVRPNEAVWYLLAGVTYTLRYEWLFYLSLPISGLACRRPGGHLLFPGGALFVAMGFLFININALAPWLVATLAFFLMGMVCASLKQQEVKVKAPGWLLSSAVCVIVAAMFVYFDTLSAAVPAALLGGAFFLMTSGSTIFGLLTWRAARRLGDISYGIYLMQGLILALTFRAAWVRALTAQSPVWHWIAVFAAGCLLVIAATATHELIEQRGIRAGKALIRRLSNRTDPRTAQAGTADVIHH
jgi:peptidoglycan/LPS O-acetylase OafA/YrhL